MAERQKSPKGNLLSELGVYGLWGLITFVLVAAWLGLVMYAERYLRRAAEAQRLVPGALRFLAAIAGIYAGSALILFLAG